MNIAAAFLQGIPEELPLNPIARWEWVFPVVESIHVCGIALLVGTILILDLRLLGLIFKQYSVSKLARQLSAFIKAGLLVVLISGPYLLSSDSGEYIQIRAFRTKMLLLALALVFHFTVIRWMTDETKEKFAGWRQPAACVSLGLWLSVVLSGLWIGNL